MGYIALKKIEELINKKIKGDALIQACDQLHSGSLSECVSVCLAVSLSRVSFHNTKHFLFLLNWCQTAVQLLIVSV